MSSVARRLSSSLLLPVLVLPFARAVFRNFTIDDMYGDERTGGQPKYGGSKGWTARRGDSDCPSCLVNPSSDAMYLSTWHDSSTFVGEGAGKIGFEFMGTDIFVFCALVGPIANVVTQSHLTLVVDSKTVATFDWLSEPGSPDFQYNVPVLAARGLTNEAHSVVINNDYWAGGGTPVGSVILFDYVQYTADDAIEPTSSAPSATASDSVAATPTTSPPSEKAAGTNPVWIGLGVALAASMALICAFIFIVMRRRQRKRQAPPSTLASVPWDGFEMRPSLPPTTASASSAVPSSHAFISSHASHAPSPTLGAPFIPPMSDQKTRFRAAPGGNADLSRGAVDPPPVYTSSSTS